MCRATSARARFGLAAIADRAVGVLLVAVVAACATPDSEPTVAAFPPVAVEAPLDLPVAKPPAPLAPRPVLPFDAASQLPGTVQMPQPLVADASESDRAPTVQKSPALAKRITATGGGSPETVVGNGRDDASDVLDRRVELKVVDC